MPVLSSTRRWLRLCPGPGPAGQWCLPPRSLSLRKSENSAAVPRQLGTTSLVGATLDSAKTSDRTTTPPSLNGLAESGWATAAELGIHEDLELRRKTSSPRVAVA